jgi:hypothetical protein
LTRADGLREEVGRRRDAALTDRDAARLRDLEATTGLGRVRGDGVVVQVADAPGNPDAVTGAGGAGPGRVLYSDLQQVANALWAVGAEAIAINDQRLTATSTIRSAGEAILVDFRPVTGPYKVWAIGPDSWSAGSSRASAQLLRRVAEKMGLSFGVKGRRISRCRRLRSQPLRQAGRLRRRRCPLRQFLPGQSGSGPPLRRCPLIAVLALFAGGPANSCRPFPPLLQPYRRSLVAASTRVRRCPREAGPDLRRQAVGGVVHPNVLVAGLTARGDQLGGGQPPGVVVVPGVGISGMSCDSSSPVPGAG